MLAINGSSSPTLAHHSILVQEHPPSRQSGKISSVIPGTTFSACCPVWSVLDVFGDLPVVDAVIASFGLLFSTNAGSRFFPPTLAVAHSGSDFEIQNKNHASLIFHMIWPWNMI